MWHRGGSSVSSEVPLRSPLRVVPPWPTCRAGTGRDRRRARLAGRRLDLAGHGGIADGGRAGPATGSWLDGRARDPRRRRAGDPGPGRSRGGEVPAGPASGHRHEADPDRRLRARGSHDGRGPTGRRTGARARARAGQLVGLGAVGAGRRARPGPGLAGGRRHPGRDRAAPDGPLRRGAGACRHPNRSCPARHPHRAARQPGDPCRCQAAHARRGGDGACSRCLCPGCDPRRADAGDHHACPMGGGREQAQPGSLLLRHHQGRVHPPHGVDQRLHARAGGPAGAQPLQVVHLGPALLGHGIQLPDRPLRAAVRGPCGGHGTAGRGRPHGGVQPGHLRRVCDRRLPSLPPQRNGPGRDR